MDDDLLVVTVKCKSCGHTWPITEEMPGQSEHVVKTDTYRCAKCGKAAVFSIGVTPIERGQG